MRNRKIALGSTFIWLVPFCSTCLPQSGPPVYIFDVLRRPEYPRTYERMFKGERNVPNWFATAGAAKNSTTDVGHSIQVNGETEEAYKFCEPHNCYGHHFTVLFSSFGQRAVGASKIDGVFHLYGNPSASEIALLNTLMQDD